MTPPLEKTTLKNGSLIRIKESSNNKVNNCKILDILNSYFSNILTSQKITEFEKIDNLWECILQATLKVVFIYRKHPSIITTINYTFSVRYFLLAPLIKKKMCAGSIIQLKNDFTRYWHACILKENVDSRIFQEVI